MKANTRLAGVAAFAGLVLACNLDQGPTAPRVPISADQAAAPVSSSVCHLGGATWEGDPDAAVLHDLAPSGVMRIAFNYGNRNNAARNPITGQLTGPGVEMTCKLATGTHAQFVAVPYPAVPPLLAGLARGAWDAGFAFDQTLEPPGITAAIPHIGVENTYLVGGDAPFQKVADVDAPGVRISVAQGNSPDIYLSRTLKYATLVETLTAAEAMDALRSGRVDAYAGGRSGTTLFIACCFPTGRLLPDNFLIANLAIVVPDTAKAHSGEGLQYIDEFVDWAKTSGLVQVAIDSARLIGNLIPAPPPSDQRIAFLQHHVARLVKNGVLTHGQGNALAVKLQGAREKVAAEETEPAMNKLRAFIIQVEAFRDAGILSEGQSASLLEIARDVVTRATA
jgi:polar amino acid transport system substrate-binding protein